MAGGLGMQPIEHFCCQNPACPDQGHRGKGNLDFRGWSDTGQRIRMVYCRTWKLILFRCKGTPLGRLPTAPGQGRLAARTHPRGLRHPGHQSPGQGGQEHGDTLRPPGGPARPTTPPREGGCFPLRPAKCSSMRSGPSSPRRKARLCQATPPHGRALDSLILGE